MADGLEHHHRAQRHVHPQQRGLLRWRSQRHQCGHQRHGRQSAPATSVVLPANNATLSGTTTYLDTTASPGVSNVIYELSGGPSEVSDVQIATATPTLYGWLTAWNTTTVPNGTYTLNSVASYAGGVSGTSAGISVTVTN